MKLLTMQIQNFKGIKKFDFVPYGGDINVYGENGTGKTTIADAYTWLLMGKDSAGITDFDVYPTNCADGVEVTVNGLFTKPDGAEFKLQRIYKKEFTRKNGESTQKLKGNTTDYYINSVPKTTKEYTLFIEEYFGTKEKIAILTNPDYFAGQMDYKSRRNILLNTFAPHYGDKEVIANHKELAPLDNHISIMTMVSEFAARLKAERKQINDRLSEIPGRIDENEKSRPEVSSGESDSAFASLVLKRQLQQNQLVALESGEEISRIRMAVNDKKSDRAKLETAYENRRRKQEQEMEENLKGVRREISEMQVREQQLVTSIRVGETVVTALNAELKDLRDACIKRHSEQFDPAATICPTCGQALPEDQSAGLRETFNLKKSEELEKMQKLGTEKKACLKVSGEQRSKDEAALASLRTELALSQRVLNGLQTNAPPVPPPFSGTQECSSIDKAISEFTSKIQSLETEMRPTIEKARQALAATESKLQALRERDNASQRITDINNRIKELLDEESKLGCQLAEKETLLQLTDTFTRLQADDITDKVNSAFKLVKWRLFEEQINGGTKPCCEAIVDGVAYNSNLNTAAKLNAGLDIINTLSKASKYDPLPIFIDNAESITDYIETNAQTIKLFVSKPDTKLRVEEQI